MILIQGIWMLCCRMAGFMSFKNKNQRALRVAVCHGSLSVEELISQLQFIQKEVGNVRVLGWNYDAGTGEYIESSITGVRMEWHGGLEDHQAAIFGVVNSG